MNETQIRRLNMSTNGLCILALVGLSLPWVKWLDFFSRNVGVGVVRGWGIIYLVIPAVLAIIITLVVTNNLDYSEEKKWVITALIFLLASLAATLFWGIGVFSGNASLILSKIPLVGFWVTLLAFLGLGGISVVNLLRLFSSEENR
jgi:hypothetical protein